jgi:hypothetical protein
VLVKLLVEFLFRLTFGIAVAMALTPARLVSSGFFRVHLWVLMGLQTLAALALWSAGGQQANHLAAAKVGGAASGTGGVVVPLWLPVVAAASSYLGAVIWMYERSRAGKAAIVLVGGLALAGSVVSAWHTASGAGRLALHIADRATAGLLLGSVTAAMLLGHWYLNAPTMKLDPLKRLVKLVGLSVALRAAVCLAGWSLLWQASPTFGPTGTGAVLLLSLRWLAGVVGVGMMAGLTWQTLKVPNTQSATGILYAGVILAFLGELTGQILSAQAPYPM